MPPTSGIVWGVALPLLGAAVLWLAWWWLGKRNFAGHDRVQGVAAAAPAAAAFLLAFFSVDPVASFPPLLAPDWLFYSALAVLVLAGVEGALRPLTGKQQAWKLLLWLLALATVVVPLSGAWRGGFDATGAPRSAGFAWAAVGGWCGLGLLLRVALGRVGCAAPLAGVWLLGLTAAITAVVMGLSGSQFTMPFRSASLGLGLLPLLGLMLLRRTSNILPAPTLTFVAALFSGLLLAGCLYYQLAWYTALLLAAGALVAAVVPFRSTWARVAVALVPVLAALTVAVIEFVRAQSFDPYAY